MEDSKTSVIARLTAAAVTLKAAEEGPEFDSAVAAAREALVCDADHCTALEVDEAGYRAAVGSLFNLCAWL